VDLKHLKYFRAVVDHGSFRKAADALHISPPALSLSVKALEEELGLNLLDRKPGRILPTAFGHSLYNSAIRIHADVQSALDHLNEIRGIGTGRLALGMLPYGISSAMGRLIGQFCERYPGLSIQTALGSLTFLLDRLKSGELDFLITEVQDSLTDKKLVREPLFRLRYGLVVGHKHPLAGKRNLSLKRIMKYRLAYARTWQVVLENWEQTFIDEGLDPPPPYVGEATDDFYIEMIAHCNTVAVMPMIGTIREAIESGQLVELHIPKLDWSSTVALVYRREENLSPDARLLMEETRIVLSQQVP
jgi:DNA-binding transcriptional LysR family regulator